jgi:mono/diheme cytochrome c family protein
MHSLRRSFIQVFSVFAVIGAVSPAGRAQTASGSVQQLAQDLKISFPANAGSVLFLEHDGRRYNIDVAAKTISEVSIAEPGEPRPDGWAATQSNTQSAPAPAAQSGGEALFRANCASCHGPDAKGNHAIGAPDLTNIGMDQAHIAQTIHNGRDGKMPSFSARLSDSQIADISQWVAGFSGAGTSAANTNPGVYKPGDDVLFNLPTGRPLDRGAVDVNFTHRFAYDAAFYGKGRGGELFGLDNFSLSSFGVQHGITGRLSVGLFRSPSFVGRPIQMMVGYNILSEQSAAPLTLTARVSVEGQNNFRKNFTENVELIVARSVTRRAQLYFVPTFSFNDRRLMQGSLISSLIPDNPGINAVSLGAGAAVDVRPTVALVAEVIPTVVGGDDLGIHRPSYSFGIQKKIFRHAFTFGFTNSPGVTVSQRAGTAATFRNSPSADTPRQLFLGFDLTRQLH